MNIALKRAVKSLSANRFTVDVSARIERVRTVPIAIETNSARATAASESLNASEDVASSAARILRSVMSTPRIPRQRPRSSRIGSPARSVSGRYALTELTRNSGS